MVLVICLTSLKLVDWLKCKGLSSSMITLSCVCRLGKRAEETKSEQTLSEQFFVFLKKSIRSEHLSFTCLCCKQQKAMLFAGWLLNTIKMYLEINQTFKLPSILTILLLISYSNVKQIASHSVSTLSLNSFRVKLLHFLNISQNGYFKGNHPTIPKYMFNLYKSVADIKTGLSYSSKPYHANKIRSYQHLGKLVLIFYPHIITVKPLGNDDQVKQCYT